MKKIKVLMQNRVDLFEKKGGDLVLMQQWKRALDTLNVEVTISSDINADLEDYDIVHLFNTTRIHETYAQFKWAKKHRKKMAITPLYHSMTEIERFDKNGQCDAMRILGLLVPNIYAREQFKNILRSVKDQKQRKCTYEVLRRGFKNAQKDVLEGVDIWIPNAESEVERIGQELHIANKFKVACDGIDISQINKIKIDVAKKYGIQDYVLCVGRIEPRKNQLALLKATQDLNFDLLLLGGVNKNYSNILNNSYVRRFQQEVGWRKNVRWIKEVPYDELGSFYAQARVHVNPSWFEVVSMVNLEAMACGCNIVLSDVGYQREYFKNDATYCDPGDIESIKNGIVQAYHKPKNIHAPKQYLDSYSWNRSAENVLKAYEEILSE